MSEQAPGEQAMNEPVVSEQGWTPRRIGRLLFDGIASFALTIMLLIFLGFLTLRGTFDQKYMSLYEVKEKYFGAWFWDLHPPGGLEVPCPGALFTSIVPW